MKLVKSNNEDIPRTIFYAGIGSRETPIPVLNYMTKLATRLEEIGFILRSGGANGADIAFSNGIKYALHEEIYLPWNGYNSNYKGLSNHTEEAQFRARESVQALHPAPHRLSQGAWKLHMRNYYIMYGNQHDPHPVDFVICWTKDGGATGGTGMAIRLAEANNIPVFNLYFGDECIDKLTVFLLGNYKFD